MDEQRCPQLYQQYRIEGEIGRGASGVCYKVVKLTTKEVLAMKKIHISSMRKHSTKEAASEVIILKRIDHPNVIRLREHFTDQQHLYIIMQYASKGDLHHILKRRKVRNEWYSESEIWEMGRQLLTAIEYLHSQNIIHRDIKTLNIFMDAEGTLYLGDLGVSKILKSDAGLYTRVGTPLYLAPQIIKYEKYDFKADIWGLGCVMYHLASLAHPFEGKNIISLGQNIVSTDPKPLEKYSPQLNKLVMSMLQKNPKKRPTATELLKQHFTQQPEGIVRSATTPVPVTPEIPSPPKVKKEEDKIADRINKIYGGRVGFDLKSRQKRRQMVNNFIGQRIQFDDDDRIDEASKEKESKVRESSDKLQQTIILTKKINHQRQGKQNYADISTKTHQQQRTNIISRSMPRQAERQHTDQLPVQQLPVDNRIKVRGLNAFCSEKRIGNLVSGACQSSSKSTISKPMFMPTPTPLNSNKKTETSGSSELIWHPSESTVSSAMKINRVRPKSSIMTKDRHEHTMKNIKKYVRRDRDSEQMNSFVETRFLKKPQVILL